MTLKPWIEETPISTKLAAITIRSNIFHPTAQNLIGDANILRADSAMNIERNVFRKYKALITIMKE